MIDKLPSILDGDLVVGTLEHTKQRCFIRDLRKAAKRLQIFVEVFGFGILASILYTNIDPDMDIDDKV